ncbi:MAG: hypothetical protein D3909_17020, partial [Candidatus Electrothrix sp. ATG1]|nr:hypothetical protein [Candidatus Electrothrix sp. ATG1]
MDKRMSEQGYIVKNPKLEASQDYTRLRREGLRHIEKLAGHLWTDYNVHDPGITLLELLCYAITDLGYRTGYDIKDILTEEKNGESRIRGQFHTATAPEKRQEKQKKEESNSGAKVSEQIRVAQGIFNCEPVTFQDLRKLLIDLDGVRNAWIEKHTSARYCVQENNELKQCDNKTKEHAHHFLNGLYDVFIDFEDEYKTGGDEEKKQKTRHTQQ